MDKDILKGQWNIVKGKVKEKWGKLTDDDITQINGQKDQLLGKLQQRYGYAKDKAESEVNAFCDGCDKGKVSSGSSGSSSRFNAQDRE